ncbi:MAG: hypothetical protein ACE5I3_14740, partial [Phycisphaerae bacterium]
MQTKAYGAFAAWMIPQLDDSNGTLNDEWWQRYDEQARYDVAMRIVSHGGMVTLDSPTLYTPTGQWVTPFNRDFVVDLFDAIRNRFDTAMSAQYPFGVQENALFDELHANAAAIESLLRRRFLLPGAPDDDGARRVPPILAELYGEPATGFDGFWRTLLPSFRLEPPNTLPRNNWQRINIGVAGIDVNERQRWAQAVSLSPTGYNTTPALASGYDRRHLITLANYSDDLARKQTEGDPNPAAINLNNRLRTYRGELKFYLGEVAKAFVEVGGAGSGQYVYDYYRGSVIIQRLARSFYDMLESHDAAGTNGWGSVFNANAINSSDPEQVVSRRQQAFMLATNLVAFATPRDVATATRGFIDVVSYVQVDATGMQGTEYVGYAPQPFFSEAIAYNERDPNDPNGPDQVAFAVELYNPNDLLPRFDLSNPDSDPFALYLPQFAIAVNGVNPNAELAGANWQVLDPAVIPNLQQRMSGRSFLAFAIRDAAEGTDHFNTFVGGRVIDLAITDPAGGDNRVKLDLWRQGRYYDSASGTYNPRWFHVDRIEVFYPDKDDWASRYRDVAKAIIDPTFPNLLLAGEPYFGVVTDNTGAGYRWGRWSVVCAWDDDDTISGAGPPNPDNEGGPATGEPTAAALQSALGMTGQGDPAQFITNGQNWEATQPWLPITPLMTMNAGPVSTGAEAYFYQQFNNLPMFGNAADLRPRSFPTVGFMLFVPRYSHVHQVSLPVNWMFPNMTGTDIVAKRSMSQTLEKERHRKGYAGNQPWNVPADFGHMPIFDNTQAVRGGSYFSNTTGAGKVPWGLLVFDYFTTLNPRQDVNADGEPDVDPLRVPGRVNINTAPWYVLANLPLIGPDGSGLLPIIPGGPVTAAYPSPSFWDADVAVLSGVVVNPDTGAVQHRLLATDPTYSTLVGRSVPWMAANNGRYRLGPWLAQAAAAYRDGVQYVQNNPSYLFRVYADSHRRNDGTMFFKYRDDVRYGSLRGMPTAPGTPPTQFGLVTLGELLNVKGFDSSRHNELPPLSPVTVTTLGRGDFVKAVSLMALLDTQYLTTRSNTFTIYTSVMDRENPQASVRSQ